MMGSPTLPGPQPHHRKTRIKLPTSILCIAGILLYVQLIILPRFTPGPSPNASRLSQFHSERLEAGLRQCAELNTPPIKYELPVSPSRANPRWNPISGQKETIILRNATLFDGESFVGAVDIEFSKGVVVSVTPTSSTESGSQGAEIVDLEGKYVTPGLIDMHSHHLVWAWPDLKPSKDVNEVHPDTGPLTPFVRSLDGMKVDDLATAIIASGGVTSSLILPGSANIMGGEGFMVKNDPNSGPSGEERVEDLLLEHGVPPADRRRYMKMACGENPKRVYGHTRMGNAWIFRQHMERARELVEKQDAWCLSAAAAKESGDAAAIAALVAPSSSKKGGFPEELELDSSVAMLRGKININVHCYEPEDFEDMLLHSKEFGFRIRAFHHALGAWKVPEMIKESGENITVATFASFGLYKKEAYDANLWAGKILSEHGVPVAYKSDHTDGSMSAKYLLYQAATAHSFHLPEELALQSVTSVPAKSLEVDHRIGYVRAGYDADIVVYDSHPLSLGATPLQVYIDGRATLDPEKVAEILSDRLPESRQDQQRPKMRPSIREETYRQVAEGKTIITGITKSFVPIDNQTPSPGVNLTMVLDNGKVICFNTPETCLPHTAGGTIIQLENGHVLPGLTAAFTDLGLSEIAMEGDTGDGSPNHNLNPLDPENVVYAKYGVHMEGRGFERARMGGVTRVLSLPAGEGFLRGVSTGIKTSGKSILDGGVFQDDVALHFTVGQGAKASSSTPTISSAISTLRHILSQNIEKDNVYTRAANGTLPVIVHVENEHDILQLISLKHDFPTCNLIIYGGAEAPSVASALATSQIPLIFSPRSSPDTFEKRNALAGPPLTRHPAAVLWDAGVFFGLGVLASESTASYLHAHSHESLRLAKQAGLTEQQGIDLVSSRIDDILGLNGEEKREIVVWEGDWGRGEGAVVGVVEL